MQKPERDPTSYLISKLKEKKWRSQKGRDREMCEAFWTCIRLRNMTKLQINKQKHCYGISDWNLLGC